MALSGNNLQRSTWNSQFGIHYYWTANRNIEGNFSDVTASIYLWVDSYAKISIGSRTGNINIAGESIPIWIPAVSKTNNTSQEIYLGQATKRVYHQSDGILANVWIGCYYPIQATINGIYRPDISVNGFNTGEIDKIPRASFLSSNPSFTIGNNLPITISRYSDSFIHTVSLSINNVILQTKNGVGTMTSFIFDEQQEDELYNITKNTSSVVCKISVETLYNGGLIGTTHKEGRIYVDGNKNNPIFDSFTFQAVDRGTKDLTGWNTEIEIDNKLSIKGKTIYQVNCTSATAKTHATIDHYELEYNKKVFKSNTTTIVATSEIGYDDFLKVSAVDSRGFKTTIAKQISLQNYDPIKPKDTIIERKKYPDNEKVSVYFEGQSTKGSTMNNVIKAFYRFKKRSDYDQEWTEFKRIDIIVGVNGNLKIDNQIISGFSLTDSYDFELKVEDYYSPIIVESIIVPDQYVYAIKEDGIYTFGEKLSPKNIVSVSPIADKLINTGSAWQYVPVTFGESIIIGNKLKFNKSDSSIIIGDDVSIVQINANCSYAWNGAPAGEMILNILKNGRGVKSCATNKLSSQVCFNSISPIEINVTPGDKISMIISMNLVGAIGYSTERTYLRVEVIE